MIRYRKSTITCASLPEGKFRRNDWILINGEHMVVTAVNTSTDTLEVARLTWLGRLQRRLTPPYRIGREGSSDRVILRLDGSHGLYLSILLRRRRLRVASGLGREFGYKRTLELQ